MSYSAEVYKILIASPGDVGEERKVISEVINQWNILNAENNKIVLLPIKWESHSAPMMGDRPQSIINEQLVRGCDLLIGVFWTRLGTATGASESGTVEEVEYFIKQGKPVMLYFSSREVDPKKLDIDQYTALRHFEEKMRKIGLTGSYENLVDFKEKLFQQLSLNISKIASGVAPTKTSALEQKKKNEEVSKFLKAGTIYLEDYKKNEHDEARAILVKGDTTRIKDNLKELGGKWNGTLKGWIFPKTKEIEVAEFIKKNS